MKIKRSQTRVNFKQNFIFDKMKQKAIFKWNSGNLALLCSKCSKIIKEGKGFTEEEKKACQGKAGFYILQQYCEQCKEKEKENE